MSSSESRDWLSLSGITLGLMGFTGSIAAMSSIFSPSQEQLNSTAIARHSIVLFFSSTCLILLPVAYANVKTQHTRSPNITVNGVHFSLFCSLGVVTAILGSSTALLIHFSAQPIHEMSTKDLQFFGLFLGIIFGISLLFVLGDLLLLGADDPENL